MGLDKVVQHALALQDAGCFSIVSSTAAHTHSLSTYMSVPAKSLYGVALRLNEWKICSRCACFKYSIRLSKQSPLFRTIVDEMHHMLYIYNTHVIVRPLAWQTCEIVVWGIPVCVVLVFLVSFLMLFNSMVCLVGVTLDQLIVFTSYCGR